MDDETRKVVGALARSIQRLGGYHGRLEVGRLLKEIAKDPKRLEPFGRKIYSQNDEDGILEEIFRRLGIESGTFIEIGVESGLECNTLYLLHKGWKGAWIEGDQKREAAIKSKFESLIAGGRLLVAIGIITPENINQALEHPDHGVREFDLLSIDIDGNDIHLLRALRARPKVLCIEYNAKWPAHIRKAQVYDRHRVWTGTDYMGASLAALNDAAVEKGYRLVGTNITGANAFFVRADLAGSLFTDDASPGHLYNPPRYWLRVDCFQAIGHPADFGPYEDLVK